MSRNLEPPTLSRLNSLLAAGYRIDHSTSREVANALWLDHPAKKRMREPTLVLYASGLVVSDCASESFKEQLRIEPDQGAEFTKFVGAVPQPTFWERTSRGRTMALAIGVFLFLMGAIWFVVDLLLRRIQ